MGATNTGKPSAAQVVKDLTRENIKTAGEPEVSVEDFQRLNEKSINLAKYGLIIISLVFIGLVAGVVFVALRVKTVHDKNYAIASLDSQLVKQIALLLSSSKNDLAEVDRIKSDAGIRNITKTVMGTITTYKNYLQLLDQLTPLLANNKKLKADLAGSDTVVPEIIEDNSPLQAYYAQWKANFFDLGCHSAQCNHAVNNSFTPAVGQGSIGKCMEICYKLRKKPANNIEYGFTYNYKDATECYCKATGGHTFFEDKTNTYIYYRFT